MKPTELKKGIYWVGAVDWNIRDFHGYSTERGSTYNAYLIIDDKVTLVDCVKKGFQGDLLHRVHEIIDPQKIDYLVVNHVEMDHSGSVQEIIEYTNPEKVFSSKMGEKALKAHYHFTDWPLVAMKTGDSINLGKRNINFLETRMLHWPDSMFSYIPEEKLLISSDAFGLHWATSERFDDQVDNGELMQHGAKYFANILMPYSALIQKLLAEVKEMGLEIDMIAPDHGVIWRGDPGKIIATYDKWSRQEQSKKALVIYDTMWHSTEMMAKAVAGGIQDQGVSVKLMNLDKCHRSDVVTEILDAAALVFGSATLNNNMLPRMADMLTYMKGLRPMNKIGAVFGSYGWSGEAVKDITAVLEQAKIEIVADGVKHQYVPDHAALHKCVEMGQTVGKKVVERVGG